MPDEYRFEYRHYRPPRGLGAYCKEVKCIRYMRGVSTWQPSERGGVTACFVYSEDVEEPVAMGLAFCSIKDNFSYRLGRQIAIGRAFAGIRGEPPKQFNGWFLWGGQGKYPIRKPLEVISVPS